MKLRIFTEPQQGASYDDLLRVAKKTEELGFDAFFRSDHFLRMGDGDGLPGPTDSWVTLAGLARETSRIKLGTLVNSATFRQPGPLAISVAQVDQMSGGRVELGMGAGWFDAEHAAYGIEFPEMAERFERFEEQVEIVHGLWATPVGEKFSFGGKHYQLSDSPALPKPVQSPLPIIMGGAGKARSAALAAKFAAEYNVAFKSAEASGEIFGRVRGAVTAAGRAPESMTYSVAQVLCVGYTDTEIKDRANAIGREVKELRANGLLGTPAEILDKIETYAAIGVETVYLQLLDLSDLDQLEVVASEILTHF